MLCAAVLVKYKNRSTSNTASSVKIIASLRLSVRDMFFVVRCGPDVVAFTVGSSGSNLVGRWTYEQWVKSEISD